MRPLVDRSALRAYRGLLHNRDYRRWFWSSLGSSLGDWIGLFALQVLVVSLAEPGSRLALFGLGGIMMARVLPSAVFGPLAGVIADWFDRKWLMIGADAARAGLFVWIAFSRNLLVLFALVIVVESLTLLYLSAKNAALPHIVARERLTEANQLTLIVTYGPLPFGAATAAVMAWIAGLLDRLELAAVDPTTAALLFNAATFAVSALLLLRLRRIAGRGSKEDREGEEEGEGRGPVAQIRQGLRAIRDRPIVRSLIVGVIAASFGAGAVIAVGPEFVRTDLGRPAGDWYGLMSTVGFGLLVGLLVAPVASARFSKTRLFPVALTVTAVLTVAAAAAPTFLAVQVVGAGLGVLAGLSFVAGYTLLHEHTPDEVRARTFATFFTGTRLALFAALGLGPFLAGVIGRWTVGVGAVDLTVSGVRITMAASGLVALVGVLWAGRDMLRAGGGDEAT